MSPLNKLLTGLLAVLLVAMGGCATQATPVTASEGETVAVESGELKGTVGEGFRMFAGIPYAAPPTGDLRWKPPAAPASWSGQRDATKPGAICSQPGQLIVGPAATPAPPVGAEDCLFLNVWTPSKADKLPVMVWPR